MQGNTESDYLLFVDDKTFAVVEAKREEKLTPAYPVSRAAAFLRLASAREKGADEDDPGMARPQRYQYDEQHLFSP